MTQYDALHTSSDRCAFCKIIRGEATSYVVFEDDVVAVQHAIQSAVVQIQSR